MQEMDSSEDTIDTWGNYSQLNSIVELRSVSRPCPWAQGGIEPKIRSKTQAVTVPDPSEGSIPPWPVEPLKPKRARKTTKADEGGIERGIGLSPAACCVQPSFRGRGRRQAAAPARAKAPLAPSAEHGTAEFKFLLRRACSQPPTAFSATHRLLPRRLCQPATPFCETSATSLHPEIHGLLSQRIAGRRGKNNNKNLALHIRGNCYYICF